MKNNVIFFLGLFAALGISWAGIVLGSNAQLGGLAPFYDDSESTAFPQWMPGAAAQGQLVYRGLGCAACHTQQVRRPGFGSDKERGWGDRQSVARDYIFQPAPQLGFSRVGPDLANLADRKPTALDASDLLHLLYAGADGMPTYRFLFETRQIGVGAQPSEKALKLTGGLEPKAGFEIVPTPQGRVARGLPVEPQEPLHLSGSRSLYPGQGRGGDRRGQMSERPNDPRLDQAAVSDETVLDEHEKLLGRHPDDGARYRLLPIAILFTLSGLILFAGTYLNRYTGHYSSAIFDENAKPTRAEPRP